MAAYWISVYNSPQEHKYISSHEHKYNSLGEHKYKYLQLLPITNTTTTSMGLIVKRLITIILHLLPISSFIYCHHLPSVNISLKIVGANNCIGIVCNVYVRDGLSENEEKTLQNYPDVTISNSLFGVCLVFLSWFFCLFVGHYPDQMFEGFEVSKVTLCVHIVKCHPPTTTRVARAAKH